MGINSENVHVFARWKNTAFANEKELKKDPKTIEKRRLKKKRAFWAQTCDENRTPCAEVKIKSARGVVDPQSLQIKRFENRKKTREKASRSFKNSTKSIPKTHFRLDVGQK